MQYEYAPESELRSSRIWASAGGDSGDDEGWRPWRVDQAGTAWYRRPVQGIADDEADDDGADDEADEAELIHERRQAAIARLQRLEDGDDFFG